MLAAAVALLLPVGWAEVVTSAASSSDDADDADPPPPPPLLPESSPLATAVLDPPNRASVGVHVPSRVFTLLLLLLLLLGCAGWSRPPCTRPLPTADIVGENSALLAMLSCSESARSSFAAADRALGRGIRPPSAANGDTAPSPLLLLFPTLSVIGDESFETRPLLSTPGVDTGTPVEETKGEAVTPSSAVCVVAIRSTAADVDDDDDDDNAADVNCSAAAAEAGLIVAGGGEDAIDAPGGGNDNRFLSMSVRTVAS